MKVLVTGGAGFIGSHTVDLMLQKGVQVVIVDNLRTGKIINKAAKFYQVDICSGDLGQIFEIERPEFVIHLAAQVSVNESLTDPWTDAQINILGLINLLNNCIQYDIKKIIFASSAAVYGKPIVSVVEEEHQTVPISFYGLSKLTAESYIKMYAKLHGLKYAILRYANVYGTNQLLSGEGGVVAIFIDTLLKNKTPVIFGTGEQTRDFIYVKDVARANFLVLTNGDNEIINISSNTATTINELLLVIQSIFKKEISPIYRPPKEGDIFYSVLSNTKAKNLLKWETGCLLEEGLEKVIQI